MGSEAPLRENLAASLLWLAEWPRRAAEGQPLFDPMMGSGTLLLRERALPWLASRNRVRRPPNGWLGHQRDSWERVGQELAELRDLSERSGPQVFGQDISPLAVRTALNAARTAGVDSFIQLSEGDFTETVPPGSGPGVLVSNPPYGEPRRGDRAAELMPKWVMCCGQFLGWSAFLFGNPSLSETSA